MELQTVIFIGRSGCGKGTQAELLSKHIAAHDPEKRDIFYLESGAAFRNFVSQSNHTAKLSREVMASGRLQPSFLSIHVWSHLLIEQMDAGKHVVIDGTPRKLDEAKILAEALSFYGRNKPIVIYLAVSRTWSHERLAGRGRADDANTAEVDKRLDWFDTDVMPAIEYLKNNPAFRFLEIDGERSIEAIHEDIIAQTFA